MPVLPEIVTRDYTDRKELAKTQFALLFRGTHRTDGKEHLLKIPLTPEAGENLKKACEFLKGHPHPSFPAVFGWHDATQNQYGVFIREFVGGESLAGYGGRLAEDQIRSIAVQIARGLAHIHFRGMIFGDVSTNNFIFDRGKVAFIDFEFLGRRHEGGTPIRGTPSFMAPELFYGNPPTIQSDLYALGVVLYFLMTGEVPVKGDDYPQLIQAHLFGEIPNPAAHRAGTAPGGASQGLTEEFGLLVLRLLNREPAERFLEANEFIRELNRICKTPFETEPEPETLAGQEKIRVLKGYSLLNDTLQQLEKKKNRTPAELATLLKIYMKRADTDKIRPLLGELSGNDRLYFEVQLSNLEGRYQETAELLKGRKNSIDERFIPPWATALYHLGEREAGEKLLEKSIVQARERKDEEKLANYQIYLGNFLLFNRQIGPAVSHYEKAVNVAGNGGFVHLEAMALMNLANAELARHQWGEAIEAYQKARRINELAGNRLEAIRTALNLSGILRFMGHLEKSRELLDQSRAYLSEFGNPQLNLYTCLLSADLEKKKKNFNEAKKHLDSAQEILKGHYTEAETGDLLVSRVEIALEEGKASEAKTGLDALEKFAGAQKDPLLEGRLKTLRMAALLFGKEEEFKPSRLISPLKEMVSQGDIEFSLDNLSRAIRLFFAGQSLPRHKALRKKEMADRV
ncbi:MAG: tetratricopeptide repeat protein [Deltaproteobacteria bacterium]|nr:tetratricopeptide repeat protein [Deltaproteobacteria bacterium]